MSQGFTHNLSGSTGVQGFSGPQGFQGFQGTTGSTGVQGFPGPQGFQGTTGSTGAVGVQGSYAAYNYLINGDFNQFIRTGNGSGTPLNYGACVADRWFPTNSGTNKVNVSMAPATGTGAIQCATLTNASGSSIRFAINQMIESQTCFALRNRTVTFQAQLSQTFSSNLRMAIISCTGTRDTYTGTSIDVVNTWSSTTYTTGNFFKATSGSTTYTVVGVSSSITTPSFGTVYSVSGTVPNDCQNLLCIVWTENAVANTLAFSVQNAGLFDGAAIVPWLPRLQAQEESMCLRYYQKSYPRATFVPTNSTAAGFCVIANMNSAAVPNQANYGWTYFDGRMRITPTIVVYSYATSTANIVADETGAENAAASAAVNQQTERGFTAFNNSGSSLTHVSFGLIFHWTADAEFVT